MPVLITIRAPYSITTPLRYSTMEPAVYLYGPLHTYVATLRVS